MLNNESVSATLSSRTTEQLYALRKQAVQLHLKGLPVMQIVAMTELSWPAVRAVLNRYEAWRR
jgi:hypothetical protein